MKELKFLFDLDSKVAIYVPGTVNVCESGENLQGIYVIKVMEKFSQFFGGATSTDALGGWMSQSNGLVIEQVKIVYSFCTKNQFVDNFDEILAICDEIKIAMGQEAVTLEFNGQIKFI